VDIAFKYGIKEAAISSVAMHRSGGNAIPQDVINIETATPHAKRFIEALMDAPFYDPTSYSFTIRHPESIFGSSPPEEEAHPIIRPTTDVYMELYQYTKITISLIGRVFLSAVLLSYGMIEDFMPLIIAGLLFLPFHHYMIAIALGSIIKEGRFLRQALLALLISTTLIFLAGVCVALLSEPPVLFEIKGSPVAGAVLAAVIGVAAALASFDDAGRRELIGLAATAHISLYPALIGLQVVFGDSSPHKMMEYSYAFLINIGVLIFAAIITYALAGTKGSGIRRFIHGVTH
jgi:hypothetical protein